MEASHAACNECERQQMRPLPFVTLGASGAINSLHSFDNTMIVVRQTCDDTTANAFFVKWSAYPRLALTHPLHTVGEEIEVTALPLGQERVSELQHVAVHDTVLPQGVVCTHTRTTLSC